MEINEAGWRKANRAWHHRHQLHPQGYSPINIALKRSLCNWQLSNESVPYRHSSLMISQPQYRMIDLRRREFWMCCTFTLTQIDQKSVWINSARPPWSRIVEHMAGSMAPVLEGRRTATNKIKKRKKEWVLLHMSFFFSPSPSSSSSSFSFRFFVAPLFHNSVSLSCACCCMPGCALSQQKHKHKHNKKTIQWEIIVSE